MRILALVVELIWRGLCDALTYMPHAIGSSWFEEVWVEDGVVRPYGVSVDDMVEFHIPQAGMIWVVAG